MGGKIFSKHGHQRFALSKSIQTVGAKTGKPFIYEGLLILTNQKESIHFSVNKLIFLMQKILFEQTHCEWLLKILIVFIINHF